MQKVLRDIEDKHKKTSVVDVRSGDSVRVHQRIKEGEKERIQVFEGLVIKTRRKGSATSSITVRRLASGVGVERTFKIHSPLIEKIQVTKRSNVNRNYLSYMRKRSGKSARLASVDADFEEINRIEEAVEEHAKEESEKAAEEDKEKTDVEETKEASVDTKESQKTNVEEEKPAKTEPKESEKPKDA